MYYIDDSRYLGGPAATEAPVRSGKVAGIRDIGGSIGVPSAQGRLFDSAGRFASGLLRSE